MQYMVETKNLRKVYRTGDEKVVALDNIDLTIEQFDLYNIPVSYEPNEEMDRKYCGKNADTQKRFQLLVSRIAEAVK